MSARYQNDKKDPSRGPFYYDRIPKILVSTSMDNTYTEEAKP